MLLFVCPSFLIKTANGQVGVTICACSPSVYTFQFNFSSMCDDTTVGGNPGIIDWDCLVDGLQESDQVTDLIPVAISTATVLELNADFEGAAGTCSHAYPFVSHPF